MAVPERFMEALMQIADEATVRELIEERAVLVESLSGGGPRSRDPSTAAPRRATTRRSFVRAIT